MALYSLLLPQKMKYQEPQQTEKRETGKGEGVHKDLQRKTKQEIKLGGSYHTMYYVL